MASLIVFTAVAGHCAETPADPKAQPYRIGLLAPISAPYSMPGVAFEETIRVLEEQINAQGGVNGHPIRIFGPYENTDLKAFGQDAKGRRYSDPLVFDTKNQPEQSVSAMAELLRNDPVAIIGLLFGTETPAAMDLLNQAGPVLVMANAFRALAAPPNKWVFGTGSSPDVAITKALKFVKKKGYTKIGIAFHPVGLNAQMKDPIKGQAKEYEIQEIEVFPVPLVPQDPRAILRGLGNSKVQAVLSMAYPGFVLPRFVAELGSRPSVPLIQLLNTPWIDKLSRSTGGPSMTNVTIIAPVIKSRVTSEPRSSGLQEEAALKSKKIWDELTFPSWQTFALADGKLGFRSDTPYADPQKGAAPVAGQPAGEVVGVTTGAQDCGGRNEYLSWTNDKPVYRAGMIEFSAAAYDAFTLIVDALKAVGPDKEKIRSYLENRKGFVGAIGTYSYSATDHQGLTDDALVMAEFKGGTWKALEE